jgi:hypothetical protein
VARVVAQVTDVRGAAVDPTRIVLHIRPPTGSPTVVESELTHERAGRFYYDCPLTAAGDYTFRWESTGEHQSTADLKISVSAGVF